MGAWSISINLSMPLTPVSRRWGPGFGPIPPSRRVSAGASVSFTSELLPEPLTPVTQTNAESGNVAVTSFRLLVVTPSMVIALRKLIGRRARNRHAGVTRQVTPGQRSGVAANFGGRALRDELAPLDSCAGAQVDQIIGRTHDRFVVFDHDHAIALLLERSQRGDQSSVVARVEPDRWFVKHVADSDQARADAAGQTNALQLAAAERVGRAVERQIGQADVQQKRQPQPHLGQDRIRDLRRTRPKTCSLQRTSAHVRPKARSVHGSASPATRTLRASGRNRAPRHAGQTTTPR